MSETTGLPPLPEELIQILIELGYEADHLLGLTNLQLLEIWDVVEVEVNQSENTVLENIIASLEVLGFDTSDQYERIQSIVNVLVGTDSWDTDVAEALMLAMADGIITDAEVEVIFSLQTVKDTVDDQSEEAEDETEDSTAPLLSTAPPYAAVVTAGDTSVNWNPLYWVFEAIITLVGERTEAFIANATGIEREE